VTTAPTHTSRRWTSGVAKQLEDRQEATRARYRSLGVFARPWVARASRIAAITNA
jgi:hypothetical protein